MKIEYVEDIKSRFHTLFEGEQGTHRITKYGFQVGDGWRLLVADSCKKLQELGFPIRVIQIKEKFGFLRMYVNVNPIDTPFEMDEVELNRRHELAENALVPNMVESVKTCDSCGTTENASRVSYMGWLSIKCNTCAAQFAKERRKA